MESREHQHLRELMEAVAASGYDPVSGQESVGGKADYGVRKSVAALRDYLPTIERRLEQANAYELSQTAPLYWTAYRIAHHRAPARGTAARHFERAMQQWAGGDKSAAVEDLVLMMEPILRTEPETLPIRYLDWRNRQIESWLRALGPDPAQAIDTYRRTGACGAAGDASTDASAAEAAAVDVAAVDASAVEEKRLRLLSRTDLRMFL